MRGRTFHRVLLTIAGLAGLAVGACSGKGAQGHTYTLRGQVLELPDPANPATGITLNHEAVDDFVSRDGEVVGMDPMSMPFPVAAGVPLDGIQAGDVVEFKLHVDWNAEPSAQIVGLRKLPPGTKLVFRAAEPKKHQP